MLVPPQPGISSEAFTAKPILTAKSSASSVSSSSMPPQPSKSAGKRPRSPSQAQSQPPTERCFPPWINHHEWALESDFLSQAGGSFADHEDGDRAKAEQRSQYFETVIEQQEEMAKEYPYLVPDLRTEMTTYVLYCPNGRKVLLPSTGEVSTMRLCVRKEKEGMEGKPYSGIIDDDVESPPSIGEEFIYVPTMPSGPPRPIHITAPQMLPIRELKRLSSFYNFLVTPPGSMPEVAKIIRQAGAETVISKPPPPEAAEGQEASEAPEAPEAPKAPEAAAVAEGDKGDTAPAAPPEVPELDPAEVAAYNKQVKALLPPLVKLVKGHLVAHVSRQICGQWFVRRAPSICIPLLWPANTNTAVLSLLPSEGPSTPRQPRLQLQLLAVPRRLVVHVGPETGPTAPPPPELHEEFLGSGLSYFSFSKLNLLEVIFNPWKQRVYTTQGPDVEADERKLEIAGEERVERFRRMNEQLQAAWKEADEEKVRRREERKAMEEAKKRERREKGLPEEEEKQDDDEDKDSTEDDDDCISTHGSNKGVRKYTGKESVRRGRPAKRPAPKAKSPHPPKRLAKMPSFVKPPLSLEYPPPSSSQTASSPKATHSSAVPSKVTKPRQQVKARQEVRAPPKLSPKIHPAVSEADRQMMHSLQYIPRPVHPEIYGHAPGPSNPLERLSPGLQQLEMPPQYVFTGSPQPQAQTQIPQQRFLPRTSVELDADGKLPSLKTLLNEVEFLNRKHGMHSPDGSASGPASPISVSSTSSAALMPPPPLPSPRQFTRQGSVSVPVPVSVAVPAQQASPPTVHHHYDPHQQSHDQTRAQDGEQLGQRLRERHLTFEDRRHHIDLRPNQQSRWPQAQVTQRTRRQSRRQE